MISYQATGILSWARLLLSVCVGIGLQLGWSGPASAGDSGWTNRAEWGGRIASSAQPGSDLLKHLSDEGIGLLVNLAPPQASSSFKEEGGWVARQGIYYVNLAIDWSHPTRADYEMFAAVLDAAKDRKIAVHCELGYRASSFMFIYAVSHDLLSSSEAQTRLNSIWTPNGTWRQFIEQTLAAHGKQVEWM